MRRSPLDGEATGDVFIGGYLSPPLSDGLPVLDDRNSDLGAT